MENKTLSFKAHIDKKDLESFSQALMEQTIRLQVENQQLKEKLEHVETLLKNVDVPIVERKTTLKDMEIAQQKIKETVRLLNNRYEVYGYYKDHVYEVVKPTKDGVMLITRNDNQSDCWVDEYDCTSEVITQKDLDNIDKENKEILRGIEG